MPGTNSPLTYFLLVIVLIALGILILRLSGKRASNPSVSRIPQFVPDKGNDKIVRLKGWEKNELQKIIADFTRNYEEDGYPPFVIERHEESEGVFRLDFPEDIHPWLFIFLINYATYPFDLNLTNRSILVAGKATLTSGFADIDRAVMGQEALFYIPTNDSDHDVVYMHTKSGITFAMSFTEDASWQRVSDARLSERVKELIQP